MRDYPAYHLPNGLTINEEDVEPLVIPTMNFGDDDDEQRQRPNVRTHQTHTPQPELTINNGVEPLLPPNWNW